MRNDSIAGATDAGMAAVASRDVALLEVRHSSPGKTIGLVGLTTVVVAAAGFIAWIYSVDWN